MRHRNNVRVAVLRPLILAMTGLGIWIAMWLGQQSETLTLVEGDIAPETFVTEFTLDAIPDEVATEAAQEAAAAGVADAYAINETVDDVVIDQIREVFDDARQLPIDSSQTPLADVAPSVPTTTIPSETTTETTQPVSESEGLEQAETTTTTTIPMNSDLSGVLFIDFDGDETYLDSNDLELPGVDIVVRDSSGELRRVATSSQGTFVIRDLAPGSAVVAVDAATVPATLTADPETLRIETDLSANDLTEVTPIRFTPLVRPVQEQRTDLQVLHGSLSEAQLNVIVQFATDDVVRAAAGRPEWLDILEVAAIERAQASLNRPGGIRSTELENVKDELRKQVTLLLLPGGTSDVNQIASGVASEIAAEFLQANSQVDQGMTEQARQDARDAVLPVFRTFRAGDTIVETGDSIGQVEIEALRQAGFFQPPQIELYALAAIVAILVAVLTIYISRFRPLVWGQMRRLALFGLLLVLAAITARGVAVFAADSPEIGYLMPAAAIGLMAAILFDARIAVLIATGVGAVTAIATGDAGFTMFAALATIAPVPWVSAISARGELRAAVVFTTFSLAVLAAGIAWFFQGERFVFAAAGYGAINGILSGLIGTAALSFLEIAFDLTTNLRLLDLTDRNHPALRLLEEEAIGTFNHSLMAGTLADRAARAVGANNLLARAAAYYHDLGKTENPQFFIENQFGSSNPHDRMPPDESAAVIRQHVIDGQELAKTFRIPSDVVEGVVTHHGDGVMRYFYHKAIERYGEENVNIDDYRHAGHKPRSKEMAVVMMADSVEGACRAIFEKEDPSPQRIAEVVEQVVGEKVSDGQLSESDLTLGDLTRAKAAMVEALKGHYHQRIPYPNFPEIDQDESRGRHVAPREDAARRPGEHPSPSHPIETTQTD